MKLILLAPLAIFVIYYDVRYRRIPNVLVLATLLAGLSINTGFNGVQGMVSSLEGFALAFFPMLLIHIFGAMGAGDVKLFGAVGSVLGVSRWSHSTFVVVVMLGAVLAVYTMLTSRNGLLNAARRVKNLRRHSARLGDAAFRDGAAIANTQFLMASPSCWAA